MNICITGSLGLIGSAAAQHFLDAGHTVIGIDNNQRMKLFGKQGDISESKSSLQKQQHFIHYPADITSQTALESIFRKHRFDAVIHCAGQPSHDKATSMIAKDFRINAYGTLLLLQNTQKLASDATFIFTSTNKVYGDNPNQVPMVEMEQRFEYADKTYRGIAESTSVDQTLHSFFGSSKLAADTYTQEFGRYLGLRTTTLRLGCVTGPHHASVKLHGFLSFLVKSLVHKQAYEIIGYKGKQVRDQIHALDVASAFAAILKKPKTGEVYNLGGGSNNAASILELIELIEKRLGTKTKISYTAIPRKGDHICYITDLTKFRHDFSNWKLSYSLADIVDELLDHELQKN
ncbi:MAG: NAD-dependent epimerase/dehydratase family protein [bacterium]|nr:NAD-dependent epimerase/dehydratase family protein [bacterium]